MTRRFALLAVLGGMLFAAAPAASAAPTYPVPGPKIVVSVTTVKAGGTVTVTACGYLPGTETESTDKAPNATFSGPNAIVGANGCVTNGFTLKGVGRHVLTIVGTDGAAGGKRGTAAFAGVLSQSVVVNVAAATSTSGSGGVSTGTTTGLPRTGGSLAALWAGAALLLAGGSLILFTRSRRRARA